MNLESDEPAYDEEFTAYAPTQAVNAADLTVKPAAVVLVGSFLGTLLRQTYKSVQAATALGLYNVISGDFFTSVDKAGLTGDRYVLADAYGQYWVIHGPPAIRRRFDETKHVKALVTLLNVKPLGIP